MAYTVVDKGSKYFDTSLYTGTGSSQSISNLNFQPDLVWLKGRSGATDHGLYDAVRGVQKDLGSNLNTAETTETTGLTAFGSDGFTVGALAKLNTSAATYVSWNWLANNTSGSSNTSGSITSTVSANTTSGFSIVSYTGTGANATVGHGLGVAPAMVIIKDRDTSVNWSVNIQPLNASLGDYTRYLTLDATSAVSGPGNTQYQNAAFTSTVFNVGTNTTTNNNTKNFIAYCFASIKGFSKIGIYTGNGSADGTFIYLGFKPAYVMIKNSSSGVEEWGIWDSKRDTYNLASKRLVANIDAAENSADYLDFVSNGFKIRTAAAGLNGSGNTLIYMAFAENPFVTSKGLPCTAR